MGLLPQMEFAVAYLVYVFHAARWAFPHQFTWLFVYKMAMPAASVIKYCLFGRLCNDSIRKNTAGNWQFLWCGPLGQNVRVRFFKVLSISKFSQATFKQVMRFIKWDTIERTIISNGVPISKNNTWQLLYQINKLLYYLTSSGGNRHSQIGCKTVGCNVRNSYMKKCNYLRYFRKYT